MSFQVQIPLGRLPINLVLVGNKVSAEVVFVKVADRVLLVVDQPESKDAIGAVFSEENFAFFEEWVGGAIECFEYTVVYDYKEIPLMLKWLQQQNLQEPTNVVFG